MPRSKLFCRIPELNFRQAEHGKKQVEQGVGKGGWQVLIRNQLVEIFLGNDGHAQLDGLVPLGAPAAACQEVGGGFGNGSGGLPPVSGNEFFKVVPRMAQRTGDDEGFAGQGPRRLAR